VESTRAAVVDGDRHRLLEVLQNLIENAVKFRSGRASRSSRWHPDGPDGPVVYVRDNGVGIDPRFHDRVFGLFERLDRGSRARGSASPS